MQVEMERSINQLSELQSTHAEQMLALESSLQSSQQERDQWRKDCEAQQNVVLELQSQHTELTQQNQNHISAQQSNQV